MALQAYQKAARAAEDPRSSEYRLFGRVTGALIDAQGRGKTGASLIEAIDLNRRLWGALAVDCLDEGNRLPKELRAQIVSLSMWVSKYSAEVMHKSAPLDPLINVNRNIMQGLQPAA